MQKYQNNFVVAYEHSQISFVYNFYNYKKYNNNNE